jgi:hypothetical protein
MSEIIYTCECGKVYKFNRRFSGRATRCIICKRDYVVPMISEQVQQTVPTEKKFQTIRKFLFLVGISKNPSLFHYILVIKIFLL